MVLKMGHKPHRRGNRSFCKKAKKYASRGLYGLGQKITKDTHDYLLGILEASKQMDDQGCDERQSFVGNVLRELCPKSSDGVDASVCRNQIGSRVVEHLVPFAAEEDASRLCDALAVDLRRNICDQFASHVIEALIMTAQHIDKWLNQVGMFIINNIEEFIFDVHAAHVFRRCIQRLSGHVTIPVEYGLASKSWKASHTLLNVADNDGARRLQMIHLAIDRIVAFPDMRALLGNDSSSLVLQVLVYVLTASDLLAAAKLRRKLTKATLSTLFSDLSPVDDGQNFLALEPAAKCAAPQLPEFVDYQPACRLVELILQIAGHYPERLQKEVRQIEKHLLNSTESITALAVHPTGYFILQKALAVCSETQFETWYNEALDAKIGQIKAMGHYSLLLTIAERCAELHKCQRHFIVALLKSEDCYSSSSAQTDLVNRLLFVNKENDDDGTNHVDLCGSKLVQILLQFDKPICIVKSILEGLTDDQLANVLCQPRGSFIADAFFVKAPFVGEKSREAFVNKLSQHLVRLATDKFGSRSIDAMWTGLSRSSTKIASRGRQTMASALTKDAGLATVAASVYGFHVSSKLKLAMFKRTKDVTVWLKAVDESNQDEVSQDQKRRKTVELFADIIDHHQAADTSYLADL